MDQKELIEWYESILLKLEGLRDIAKDREIKCRLSSVIYDLRSSLAWNQQIAKRNN